jgi:ABC-type transport system involved in cytochrome c biogenesis permease subunit
MSTTTPAARAARFLPWAALALALLYAAAAVRPQRDGGFPFALFGRLPIVDLGRTKPLDTYARTTLMIVSNRQSFYLDGTDGTSDRQERRQHSRRPALHWLLDVWARPEQARGYRVVRIDHPDLKAVLELDRDRKYFAVDELVQRREELEAQIQRAREVPASDRNPYQRHVLDLAQKLTLYFNAEDVMNLLLVPPQDPERPEAWSSFAQAQHQDEVHGQKPLVLDAYRDAMRSWRDGAPDGVPPAVGVYAGRLQSERPELARRLWFETFFNRAAPFLRAIGLYVLVFVLAALSWLRLSRALASAALWVLGVALAVHTLGLVARIYIQGRPPVTNLYSSAIFVGWGAAMLGLFLERFYKNGIGAVTAAGTGFLTLLVAHNLALDGDTMTMMQAVLDTNFWLATHVVVITLGYASTFLAGFLGSVYILRGLFTRSLSAGEQVSLPRMIYGVLCFATLFSFVGTILGGIWADQSWGRFWGWDPKENGALLIVLWNALILHARWGGMVRQRGLAVLAVAGNIVTSWSWFGTNMLGVGLHAYGFIDSALLWMFTFIGAQLVLIGLGLMPLARWRSLRPAAAAGDGSRGDATLAAPAAESPT